MIRKFKKKPIIIEAIKWDGKRETFFEIYHFTDGKITYTDIDALIIDTLEGTMIATIGDYIIKGINGEFYPCKPDVFQKTYDEVRGEKK